MNLDEIRTLTPWSFFLPVALAVMLGVLGANALGALLFGDDDAVVAAAAGPETAAIAAGGKPDASAAASKATARDATTRGTPDREPVALEPVSLPGPSSARRDGETRACIGGTIAVRAENGWEQEVVNDAPARCMASSR
jgi:hypothetical protein